MIERRNKPVILWLLFIAFLVFLMVFIGGITRLTDSGLSMVDWKPLMGAIPPMSEGEWLKVFTAYQQYPEYKMINHSMTLSEFKYIFFWEYFHRLMGRFVGIAFFFPFVYFYLRKNIRGKLALKTFIAFVLGGMQGVLGWYMVKSGLVDRPDVSHYRLAAHLSLAFLIIGYIFWIIFELVYPDRVRAKSIRPMHKSLWLFLVVLALQIVYGAFVAGLDAGLTHNTFPKMGQSWIPLSSFSTESFLLNFFENKAGVQFVHRSFAWILTLLGLVLFWRLGSLEDFKQKRSVQFLLLMLVVQFLLGVSTLLMLVPVALASAHQVGACVLLVLTLRSLYMTRTVIRS